VKSSANLCPVRVLGASTGDWSPMQVCLLCRLGPLVPDLCALGAPFQAKNTEIVLNSAQWLNKNSTRAIGAVISGIAINRQNGIIHRHLS
jgi:hypothetical protein